MKILILSYNFPYPPTGGSIIRDYNLFKYMSKHYELYWIVMTLGDLIDSESLAEMKKYFREIFIIDNKIRHSMMRFVKSVFTGKPYILSKFESKKIKEKITEIINNYDIDILFCDHIYLAQNIPDGLEKYIPVIPNNEDHAYTYYMRLTSSGSIIRSIYAGLQWKKLLKYEVGIYKRYGIDITTSEREKELLLEFDNSLNIKAIPNGVDVNYFTPRKKEPGAPNVVYTAWYKYYPNQQAAIEFARKIFPRVREMVKDFRFYIVGKEPPEHIVKLGNIDGIIVTGEVPDVRPYIGNSDAVVVPLRVGGGTRLKILEAMGMAKPVISTSLGAEGLNITDGVNILIADENEKFADYIVQVLKNNELREKLSANGRKFVEENYSWERIGKELNDTLEKFYSEFRPSRE